MIWGWRVRLYALIAVAILLYFEDSLRPYFDMLFSRP